MLVGHLAVGLIAKRVEPKISLGTLISLCSRWRGTTTSPERRLRARSSPASPAWFSSHWPWRGVGLLDEPAPARLKPVER